MRVKSGRAFNDEQKKWLELISRHLIKNMLMEKDDVDYLAIFSREGTSWAKLNKVFDYELENIIKDLNTAIAA